MTRRIVLLLIVLALCAAAQSQGPPGPGNDPAKGLAAPAPGRTGTRNGGPEGAPVGPAEGAEPARAQERPNLRGVDLTGVELPPELQGVAPDVAAELLKIWPKKPPPPDGKFSMSFRMAEIQDFLQFMADSTGYVFLVPPELTGKVTITTQVDVAADAAFHILDAWLSVKGFGMTRDDAAKLVIVETTKRAKTRGSELGTGLDPDAVPEGDQYVTHLALLKTIDAQAAVDLLKPLVDEQAGIVSASGDLNAIVISDAASNVRRLVTVLSLLEREVDQTEVHTVAVVRLQNADAGSVANMLTQLFQTGMSSEQMEAAMRRGMPPPEAGGMEIPGSTLVGLRGQVRVAADARTNSVIVLASAEKIDMVKTILAKLDDVTGREVIHKVFTIENADPADVVESLNELWEQPRGVVSSRSSPFSGFMSRMLMREGKAFYGLKENVAIADTRTSKIVVTASPENMPVFEAMVKALDRPKPLQSLTRVFRLRNADAEAVATAINDALQGRQGGRGFLTMLFGGTANSGTPLDPLRQVTATAETITNQVIVTALPQAFPVVERMINDLDKRVPQVFVRVIIADVTLSNSETYGVEWNWFAPNVGGDAGTSGDVSWTATDPLSSRDGLRWGVVSESIQAYLSAVKSKGNVRIISTPHIMTLDNQWGSIEIGERIPVLTGISESTSGRITQQIEYQEATIGLYVMPQVGESGFISLRLYQRIDDVERGRGDANTPAGQPTFIQRRATSTVLVRDGQTVIIGGILQQAKRKVVDKVPILSEIPLLGNLFRHKREEKGKTELMVFLTPYVVLDEDDAARHTREEADQMRVNVPGMDTSAKKETRWDKEAPGEAIPPSAPGAPAAPEAEPSALQPAPEPTSETVPAFRRPGDRLAWREAG
ncbi:MAG TPA: secretin N-terminal domain-containing protein [Armatimonadota bacterium]|nr:secretin N-terminal domain-containing protein [Armatimonadota bacterium]